LTKLAYNKAKDHGTLIIYPYLKLYDTICFPHYMSIVEGNKINHQNNENESEPELSSEGISLASKF
ncbi:15952_t:CDS:1, partial [Rhizophagus irregularis]